MRAKPRLSLLLACAVPGAAVAQADEAPADPAAAPAAFSLTGSLDAMSQYRFRGVSRSDGQPAVQGDVSVNHTSGFYGGMTLASLSPGAAVDLGHAEIDVYAGYDHALGHSGLAIDLGLRDYLYADRARADLVELSAALDRQIGPVDLRAGVAYAPPQAHLGRQAGSGAARDNTYIYGQIRGDVPGTPLHLHAHCGRTAGGLELTGAYGDYRVGLGASRKAWGIDVSLVGTTVARAAVAATPDPPATWRAVRRAGVASVTYQF